MKKFTAILVAIVLMMNMMAICASAANYANAQPIDITNNIKWVTLYEMYEKKLPVVRADAVFIPAIEYEAATAPGSGMRTITITDWAEKGMTTSATATLCMTAFGQTPLRIPMTMAL